METTSNIEGTGPQGVVVVRGRGLIGCSDVACHLRGRSRWWLLLLSHHPAAHLVMRQEGLLVLLEVACGRIVEASEVGRLAWQRRR